MNHLLVRHRVADFTTWEKVFDSHLEAQLDAGLRARRVYRNLDDPDEVFLFFEVHDIEQARRFLTAPEASDAADESGVLDEPDVYFLT